MHPIPIEQRVTAIALSLTLMLLIVHLIRKGKLREEYALVWLGAGLLIFVLSLFGGIVSFLATLFAVSYAPTLVLVLGLFFALVVLLSQSVVISTQADSIRDLARHFALMEWRLRQLEADKLVPTGQVNGAGLNPGSNNDQKEAKEAIVQKTGQEYSTHD